MATAQFIGQLLLRCGAHGPIDRLVHACLSSPLDDPFDSFSEELAKPAALSTSCTEQLFISHGLQFKRLISHFSSSFNDWVGVSGGLPLRLLWSIPREWLRSIPETAPSGSVLRTMPRPRARGVVIQLGQRLKSELSGSLTAWSSSASLKSGTAFPIDHPGQRGLLAGLGESHYLTELHVQEIWLHGADAGMRECTSAVLLRKGCTPSSMLHPVAGCVPHGMASTLA